jgi:hypothetical protein
MWRANRPQCGILSIIFALLRDFEAFSQSALPDCKRWKHERAKLLPIF